MAPTATSLAMNLGTTQEINFYTRLAARYNDLYENNLDKLEEQVKYEEKHCDAYDKCYYAEDGKEVKRNGRVYANNNECEALAYADEVVHQYNQALKEELAEMDMDYEIMKNMIDTKLTALIEREKSEKSLVQQNAQDTGLISQ